jgi:hypothetical protein
VSSRNGGKSLKRDPALAGAKELDALLRGIKATKDKPTPELMAWIEGRIQSVRDVLLEPDPVRQRAYLIVIAIRQSTRIEERKVFGEMRKFVYVEDRALYNWAIHESHRMPERFL